MNYKQFVKSEMAKMKGSKLPVGERMKHIAKLWSKHKSTLKGGEIETDKPIVEEKPKELTEQEKQGQMLQEQEKEYGEKIKKSLYGQYATPFIKPSVMMDRGIPWILAQHPNQYSANPNEVLLYRNSSQFLNSPFYKKYQDRFKMIGERKGYGTTRSQVIPGKDFRLVFRSRSTDDNYQYYMDAKDEDEFMDILDEAKETNFLVPIEFISKKFMDINKQIGQKEAEQSALVWQAGYQTSYDQLEPVIKQQQEDIENLQRQLDEKSSSSGSWLDSIAEIGVGALKMLI